jgi:transposase
MTGEILSPAVRQALLQQHKKERDRRVADRIKAVILRDEGWTYDAIAEALLLSEEGVRQHLKAYEASGKLKPENGGSDSYLTEAQSAKLIAHLESHLYVKTSEIVAYVHTTFGIRYSVRGMTDWLKRHDFTFHQPCGVPAKADAGAQQAFVERYENLKKNLGAEDQIVFMDGVHPSHAVRFMRGWIRKGVRKEIPTNARQKRLNILGALNLEVMTLHAREYDTLNAEAVIAFLTFLLAAMPKGVLHIILDRGRYQNCVAVWEFAAVNARLRLHYLPPYSPNINAIEPAWKIMHEHTTNNRYHAHFKDFTEAIRTFFDVTFPKNAQAWTDRLTDNFRILGAPLPAP